MRAIHHIGWGLLAAISFAGILSIVSFQGQTEASPERTPRAAAGISPEGFSQQSGDPTTGKTLFQAKCAGCHTVGGGKLAGPDLKGVTNQRTNDWLVGFITAPDKVIASGDPTAKKLVAEFGLPMPNLGISAPDAGSILAYIASQSGGAAAPNAQAAAPALPPGNAATGRLIFIGEQRLANGGPACIGCHNVAGAGALGGGSWGLDLTHAQAKTGSAGLASILKSPPFPGMAEAFASHPIKDQEIADLTAFLAKANTTQEEATPAFTFPLIGLGAFAIFVGLMQFAGRGRAQGVRRRLLGRRGR